MPLAPQPGVKYEHEVHLLVDLTDLKELGADGWLMVSGLPDPDSVNPRRDADRGTTLSGTFAPGHSVLFLWAVFARAVPRG